MTTTTLPRVRPSAAITVAWVLQILAAAMFLFAGGSKLTGQQAMVDTFGQIGLGQWFRYLTGIIEVGSAVLLRPVAGVFRRRGAFCHDDRRRDHASVRHRREPRAGGGVARGDGSDCVSAAAGRVIRLVDGSRSA